jgi:transposase
VPFPLLRQEVEARITAATVEIFHRGKRVACHPKSVARHRATMVAEHMPSSHRRYRDWTRARIQREAAAIGINSATFVEVLLDSRPHPEQGFRSCVGVLSLVKRYGPDRVEAACERALRIHARSYSSVVSILKNNLDRRPPTAAPDQPPLLHANIRGPGYYH